MLCKTEATDGRDRRDRRERHTKFIQNFLYQKNFCLFSSALLVPKFVYTLNVKTRGKWLFFFWADVHFKHTSRRYIIFSIYLSLYKRKYSTKIENISVQVFREKYYIRILKIIAHSGIGTVRANRWTNYSRINLVIDLFGSNLPMDDWLMLMHLCRDHLTFAKNGEHW